MAVSPVLLCLLQNQACKHESCFHLGRLVRLNVVPEEELRSGGLNPELAALLLSLQARKQEHHPRRLLGPASVLERTLLELAPQGVRVCFHLVGLHQEPLLDLGRRHCLMVTALVERTPRLMRRKIQNSKKIKRSF
jgi:hypothetical protein